MRTLTSIESATNIQVSKTFTVEPTSATAFSFNDDNIVSVGALTWQNTIKGGISIPSNYQITLSSSLGFIKSNLDKFIDQKTILEVQVNSDTFTPHIGKVESIRRNGNDPNTITLNIYDTSLSSRKKYPINSIVDSYDTLPKVADNDFGYPAYYGRQIRPFYFYPLDQDAQDFIGPINVSGAVRQESCYYMRDTSLDIDIESPNVFLLRGSWSQESGGNNQINLSNPFEVSGFGTITPKFWRLGEEPVRYDFDAITFKPVLSAQGNSVGGYYNGGMGTHVNSGIGTARYTLFNRVDSPNQDIIRSTNHIDFCATYSFTLIESSTSTIELYVASGDSVTIDFLDSQTVGNGDTHCYSEDLSGTGALLLTKDSTSYIQNRLSVNTLTLVDTLDLPLISTSLDIQCSLLPEAYNNYSVFITETNCTNIAISENPMGILADIFDQTSVEYVASQNSATQLILDARGYQFQCLFDKRTDVYEIARDFGEATRTNMWVADSGMINFYFYQNSDQASTDVTLTLDDMFSFNIVNNPISTSAYGVERAKRFDINYDYSFHKGVFQKTVTANPNNNTFCQSADAAGIDKEIAVQTPYIMDTDTASKYLGHLVAFNTLSSEFVEMSLPARFFQLELCDILRVQHPMIVGSESKYQVVQLSHNYDNGNVFVKAQELIEIP